MVSHGHSLDAIKSYTIGQVRAFLTAHERQAREQLLGNAINARMAQVEGKAWRKYIKKLQD
ncbi:MAG: hypothetical protein ACTS5I_17575 [Rhodanobacter sp.]